MYLSELFDELAQRVFGGSQFLLAVFVACKENGLFCGVDVADVVNVDYVFPAQALEPVSVGRLYGVKLFLYLRQSERYEEMGSIGIIHIGIMVIGCKKHQPFEVYSIQFTAGSEA